MSDDELRDWQSQWQQPPLDVARAHARARRDDRRHRLLAVAEYLGMGALLAWSLGFAAWRDTAAVWAWMAALWMLGVPALAFAWWNRRGLWGRAGLSAREHLQLSLRRCRHGLRALRVGYVLLAASTAVVLLFAFGVVGGRTPGDSTMLAILAAVVAVHLLVMVSMQRRLRRRSRLFSALLRDSDDRA